MRKKSQPCKLQATSTILLDKNVGQEVQGNTPANSTPPSEQNKENINKNKIRTKWLNTKTNLKAAEAKGEPKCFKLIPIELKEKRPIRSQASAIQAVPFGREFSWPSYPAPKRETLNLHPILQNLEAGDIEYSKNWIKISQKGKRMPKIAKPKGPPPSQTKQE